MFKFTEMKVVLIFQGLPKWWRQQYWSELRSSFQHQQQQQQPNPRSRTPRVRNLSAVLCAFIIILWPDLLTFLNIFMLLFRTSRSGWRLDRDMGLMNAIGLQPRQPAPSVTSQGTQTPVVRLQNAETQTERELPSTSVLQTIQTPRHCESLLNTTSHQHLAFFVYDCLPWMPEQTSFVLDQCLQDFCNPCNLTLL